jgi:molybdenum cofactor cytidylyltransferase
MISAIVLAAGLSTRMGQPKMLLPWGRKTVLEQVVDTLLDSEIRDIVVVAGAHYQEFKSLLTQPGVKVVFNPVFENGEMTCSLQKGLSFLSENASEVMVVLGDQPFLTVQTAKKLINASARSHKKIIMPSINGRRGHPWIINHILWQEIASLKSPENMRDFFNKHNDEIEYVLVEDGGILKDMDTREDYEQYKPKGRHD